MAIAAINAANEDGSNIEIVDSMEVEYEIADTKPMKRWFIKITPESPGFIQTASQSHHFRRWVCPSTYTTKEARIIP